MVGPGGRCYRSRPRIRAACWGGLLTALMCVASALAAEVSFAPQGSVKDVRQVTARFAQPMVAFGDPRVSAPFDIDCPLSGGARWADSRNWVYDFAAPAPAGVTCRFTLKSRLFALDGSALAPASFQFDTGGPSIRASMPYAGMRDIDAEQIFVFALDSAVDLASVGEHASCAIENIAERVPLDVLTGDERARVIAQRRQLGYAYFQVLWQSGHESVAKVDRDDLARAEQDLLVVRCRRRLPPETAVSVVWGAGIRAPNGLATHGSQTLAFRTRPDFNVRIECERANARAGCLPMKPVRVVFSAPVATAQAMRIVLDDRAGRLRRPRAPAAGVEHVEVLEFAPPFPEHARVELALAADFVDDAGRRPANAARFPLAVEIDGYPPLAKFAGTFAIVEARTGGVLPVSVRRLEPDVVARTEPLSLPARSLRVDTPHAIARWLRTVEEAMAPSGDWREDDAGQSYWYETTGTTSVFTAADTSADFALPVAADGPDARVIGIPLGKPGLHVVEIASERLGNKLLGRAATRYVATTALVTNLAVHFKWGRETSLVWVTSLDEAAPVAHATVDVWNYCTGERLWQGTTAQDGRARIAQTLGEPHAGSHCSAWSAPPLIVTAHAGDDLSFDLSFWHGGISPYAFNLPQGSRSAARLAHSVLDRSLFRAGETVSMKHFVRQHSMAGVHLPESVPRAFELVIAHTASDDRIRLPLAVDSGGVATTRWEIPREAKLGEYSVTLAGVDDASWQIETARFKVEEFRVPTMRGVVQGPRLPQVRPAGIALDLFLAYLAGGAAGGAEVKLRTQFEPRTLQFTAYLDYAFGGEPIETGVRTADDDGGDPFAYYLRQFGAYRERSDNASSEPASVQHLTLDRDGTARVVVAGPKAAHTAHTLRAELDYQDANGERLSSTAQVAIWPAAVALGVKVEGGASTRDSLRLKVLALDLDGGPRAGQAVEVELFQRLRSSYRKRLIGGFYAYESTVEHKSRREHCRGLTDARGVLDCRIALDVGGEYVVHAKARDAQGHAAYANTSAWVARDEDWWFDPGDADRMDVIPEQREYAAGDTARLQVRMPFRRATALVTVEREGVIDSFVTELRGTEPVIELPIARAYAPNVYVSVLAVRGRISTWRAALGSLARYLELPIQTEGALPGALIDLSKPAYRMGYARLRVDWQPHRLNVQVEPVQKVFKVREQATVEVAVTRADGGALEAGAEIALAAVDEGLLELAPNETWDLLRAMMGERGIEVFSSTAQMQVVGKRHYGRKAVPHGGGGGRGAARERFDTLLMWQDVVKLDARGRARVTIPLNDSLTAFRIVAVAHDGLDRFGTGSATIRTSQDLMLHAGLPPLVRAGDAFEAIVSLRNASERALEVEVDAELRAGDALPVALATQTHALAAGQAIDVTWPVTAPLAAQTLGWDVRATAVGADAADHLRVTQQVVAPYPVRTYQASLTQIDQSWVLQAAPPQGALPGQGGLGVTVQARLADGLDGVREYMSTYPYTCVEQRLSQAVALDDEERWRREIARLPLYLDRDGLARYFATEALEGSDTLTSYILSVADEAEWDIPDATRNRMLAALAEFVAGRIVRDSALPTADLALRKLAAIAALARYEHATPDMLATLNLEPKLWPSSGVIDWLDILNHLPSLPGQARLHAEALDILRGRLNFQGTVMRFATERSDALWWLMIDGDVNAARAIGVVLDHPDWHADLPRMLRGALTRQVRGHWSTTVANAWGMLAVRRMSARFEATPVAGTTNVRYGGQARALDWNAAMTSHALELAWTEQPAALAIAHAGAGKPWLMVASRAAVPLTSPLFTSFSITRQVTPLEQATPGRYTRGDVVRVRLDIESQADAGWVVVDDPIPAGASILGGGLARDSQVLASGEVRAGHVFPAFEERRFDAFRAYYRLVPAGRWTVEYSMRLNNPGSFRLPATRVEAMYAPEMFAELPNADVVVAAP